MTLTGISFSAGCASNRPCHFFVNHDSKAMFFHITAGATGIIQSKSYKEAILLITKHAIRRFFVERDRHRIYSVHVLLFEH